MYHTCTPPNLLMHSSARRKEKEFWDTVKSHLTYEGYFEKFPTPKLLREAQDKYREMKLEPPLDATGKPLPYPTPCSKDELISRELIEEVDAHALGTPRLLAYEDLYQLVKYLTGELQTGVEKLRAIFRWIASQDLKLWHDEVSFNSDSAAFYLARIRAKKANHNQLLQRMCSLSNIFCVKVRGYVKGVDYGMGQDLTECDSTWTAVLVDGSWRLLDVYWATCHRVHTGDTSWSLIDDGSDISSRASTPRDSSFRKSISKTEYAYNDYYFLTDPEQFIYSHFPIDEKWQLLARTVSLEEAKHMALLKRNFFSIGMDIVSHPKYLITCDTGEVTVTFTAQEDTRAIYKYELYIETEEADNSESIQNLSLDRYVFLEKVNKENIVNLKLRFPQEGKFKLKLLAKEQDESSFYYTCTYIVDCTHALCDCRPLPKNERGEWGPGIDTEELGIDPISHDTGEVKADDGKAEVRFGLSKPVEFTSKLVTDEDEELPNRVLHRLENQEVVFNVRVPDEGEYALNLYAREPGSGEDFPNVCNYLLKCEEEPEDKKAFPPLAAERLGPTGAFEEFGMKNVSVMPALMLAPVSGEVTLQFKLSKLAVFIPELLLHQDDDRKADFSEYVMWDIIGGTATFYISLPRQGLYSLQIRAKQTAEEDTYTPVFHSIVDAIIPKKQCLPCPQQSIDWPAECHVIKPNAGVLPARELVKIEIEFPQAFEVVATTGNGSKLLQKNDQDVWTGDVMAGNEDSVMTISVRYSNTDDYHYILTYKIKNKEEMVGEKLRQLERYREAVERAERLREAGKLPKVFDWSLLESDDSGTEIDDLENTKETQTVLTLLSAELSLTSQYLYYGE